ncbi:MAG TPA: hypothetical protein VH917_07410 [Ignavibacteriaceae bacterium]|jgi:hypothetical protein
MKSKVNNKQRQLGKQKTEKKPLIDPKHKNTIWTILILLTLLYFFIVNNTREIPNEGPYPPNYNPGRLQGN